MITAMYIDTGEILNIFDFDNPRESIDKNRLCCRLCKAKVSLKDGRIRAKHFYHLNPCTSILEKHKESIEHDYGKKIISEHTNKYWEEYSKVVIEFEYQLPEINRVEDIAMIFPNGWIVVHEIQLSSTTTEYLEKRTNDYNSIGIDAFWWLGKSADTNVNREWSIEKYGYSLAIEYAILKARAKDHNF